MREKPGPGLLCNNTPPYPPPLLPLGLACSVQYMAMQGLHFDFLHSDLSVLILRRCTIKTIDLFLM